VSPARRLARLALRAMGAPLRRVHPPGDAADAVVVLGAPLTPDGALTAVLEERVAAGVALWRAGAAPILCVTGGGARHVEADAMAARARELGVPDGALRVERAARTTAENAANVARLLAADQVRRVWLVTQPFHTRRALRCFRRAGLEPRAWHIADSLEYQRPSRAIRWVAREYAAWLRAWTRR
jgi:uncharacterized SAM-binding protein YcdF (DUF218 family)